MKDCWANRTKFRELLAEFRKRNGVKNAAIAELLDISPESLKKYISPSPTHRPGEDVLKKAGALLGMDWREFLDAPASTATPGVPQEKWAAVDEDVRIWNRTMFEAGARVTPEFRKAVLDLMKTGLEKGVARKKLDKESETPIPYPTPKSKKDG